MIRAATCYITSFVEVLGEIFKDFFGLAISSVMDIVIHNTQFVSTTNIVIDIHNYNF